MDMSTLMKRVFGTGFMLAMLLVATFAAFARDVDDDLHQLNDLDPSSRRWLVEKLRHTVGKDPVGSYVTEDVTTVGLEASLSKAAREMVRNRVHHLPVVDDNNKVQVKF